MPSTRLEIICSACGADALLRREPVYEGLRKAGERLSCAACGHVFASEAEVPFKQSAGPAIFTEADRVRPVDLFKADERNRNCRYCVHYLVNPFKQYCARHHREVAATDVCAQFTRKPDESGAARDS